MRSLKVSVIVLLIAFGCSGTVAEAQLYGVNGSGNSFSPTRLYELSEADGSILQDIGPVGFDEVSSLDFHAKSGVLYGIAHIDFDNSVLITIDKTTGAGTEIGEVGVRISDITFDPTGVLYGWSALQSDSDLYTIDLNTGLGTKVGEFGSSTGRTGLAANSKGRLFMKSDLTLREINPATGQQIGSSLNLSFSRVEELHNILEFDANDALFTGLRSDAGTGLFNINQNTGDLTISGLVHSTEMSAIAFGANSGGIPLSVAGLTEAQPASNIESVYDEGFGDDIPDDDSKGIQSTVFISENVNIEEVSVRFGSNTNFFSGIVHPRASDLKITLEHNGTVVELTNRPGGPGNETELDDFEMYIFEDGHTTFWNAIDQSGGFLLGGYYSPSGKNNALASFTDFTGSSSGLWTLTVADLAPGMEGELKDWTLGINRQTLFEWESSFDQVKVDQSWFDNYNTPGTDSASAIAKLDLTGIDDYTLARSKLVVRGEMSYCTTPNSESMGIENRSIQTDQLFIDASDGFVPGTNPTNPGGGFVQRAGFIIIIVPPIIFKDPKTGQLDIPVDYDDGDDFGDFDFGSLSFVLMPDELRGDANDDDMINNADVAAFRFALKDLPNLTNYRNMYPNVDPHVRLDMNGDGMFNSGDTSRFIQRVLLRR